jgi:predicted transcriptional regulator
MARVIDDFARDGVETGRMTVRLVTVEDVVAEDETLCYVVGEETVVWLEAGERHRFDRPTTVLLASARG